jgi:hypothetical protein
MALHVLDTLVGLKLHDETNQTDTCLVMSRDNRSPPQFFFGGGEQEEYNRRKLCTNGYSKEAREIAGKVCGCGGFGCGCELCVWLVLDVRAVVVCVCVVGSFFVSYFFGAKVLASYHTSGE